MLSSTPKTSNCDLSSEAYDEIDKNDTIPSMLVPISIRTNMTEKYHSNDDT